jgi:GTPase SAR1 family protein
MEPIDDYVMTFMVVGELSVGKTSLINAFTNKIFREYNTTPALDFISSSITVDQVKIKLKIWDTVISSTAW